MCVKTHLLQENSHYVQIIINQGMSCKLVNLNQSSAKTYFLYLSSVLFLQLF